MNTNIHPVERGIRVALGLFLMSLSFWGPINPVYLLGIIPVATGLSGWCPLYGIFGFRTCKAKVPPVTTY
jgi:hypothetical protein